MRVPPEAYPMLAAVETHPPGLTGTQREGVVWWVYGAVLGGNACQAAVATAPEPLVGPGGTEALRRRLREWHCDGVDEDVPCRAEVDVTGCFAPLLSWVLAWVLAWWHGDAPPLAVDATALGDRLVVLSVSVLSRGGAIPVARHVTAANRPGAWLGPILGLLAALAPAAPSTQTVVVLADRGPWSPRPWAAIRGHGRHPLLRIRQEATFRPGGTKRVRASSLLPGPGHAWVGAGTADQHAPKRKDATLVAVGEAGQDDPCRVLTDLDPEAVGPCWYGLRAWIEPGFRALKSLGWRWERTRRPAPNRVARHWLVWRWRPCGSWRPAPASRTPTGWAAPRPTCGWRCRPRRAPGAFVRTASSSPEGWRACAGSCWACAGCGPGSGSGPGPASRPTWS